MIERTRTSERIAPTTARVTAQMNPRAAPDPEAGVRAPDAPERLRLVEDDLDELQWSDGARTTVAVQVSAAADPLPSAARTLLALHA